MAEKPNVKLGPFRAQHTLLLQGRTFSLSFAFPCLCLNAVCSSLAAGVPTGTWPAFAGMLFWAIFAEVLEGSGTWNAQNNICQSLSCFLFPSPPRLHFPPSFLCLFLPPSTCSPAFFLACTFTPPLEKVILLRHPTHPSQAQPFSQALRWDSAFAGGSAD